MDTRASPTPAASSSRNKPSMPSSNSTAAASRTQNNGQQTLSATPPPPAAGALSSKSARRPSTSAGSTSSRILEQNGKPTKSTSNLSLKQKSSKKLDDAPKHAQNEELIKSYASGFDHMRQLVTCKICVRLMYEPYVVSCGHIYCYSCLATWFSEKKKNKTCPDCRAPVTQIPSPAYLIREMVQTFFSKTEFLAPGETIAQHDEAQKEEADIVQKDKDNNDRRTGGLFKGLFKSRRPILMGPVRDIEDNVDRCPLCHWELEDGSCTQCGYHGEESSWADSVEEGFSDLEQSEMDQDDLDGEMEEDEFGMHRGDYGLETDMDMEMDLYGHGYNGGHVQQWLMRGHPPMHGMPRARAAHSAAGGRRRYSQSLASDVYTEDMDMGTLEEEDEEADDDDDSSMNNFLDDGATETSSEATQSTESEPVQASGPQRRARARRVVEQSESSSASHADEDVDEEQNEEDDDEPPIAPGRRRHQNLLARANGAARASSSTSTEASAHHELDEDTARLLETHGWSPLAYEGLEEEMEGEEDNSDGARTTVGWDTTTNSNDRRRMTSSLTPTADRPLNQTRPRSRVGQSRVVDGSRGLRRRNSILSVSTVNYEDGEADDDDSGIDGDGDSAMGGTQLRQRRSIIRLRDRARQAQNLPRPASRNHTLGDGIDVDTDENSDETSIQSPRRRAPRAQEYDPRISWMFAQHQQQMFQHAQQLDMLDQLRSTTPMTRPRTSNRNRNLQQETVPTPFSPLTNTANPLLAPQHFPPRSRRNPIEITSPTNLGPTSPSSRHPRSDSATSDATQSQSSAGSGVRLEREGSLASATTGTTMPAAHANRPMSQHSNSSGLQSLTSGPEDPIERPRSRLPARPPSANARRVAQGLPMAQPNMHSIGLSVFNQPIYTRNPYQHVMQVGPLRTRQSTQRLRNSDSTATLRASNSRSALRAQASRGDVDDDVPMMRTRPSRMGLRTQPSVHMLQSQPSVQRLNSRTSRQALRQPESLYGAHPQIPAVYLAPAPIARPPSNGPSRSQLVNEDNRTRNVQMAQSGQPQVNGHVNPPRRSTNPFMTSHRSGGFSGAVGAPNHVASGTGQAPIANGPGSPSVSRRRSTRNMGAPAGAILPTQLNTGTASAARPRHNNIAQIPAVNAVGR